MRDNLESIPPAVQQLFEDILKFRVDPTGETYGYDFYTISESLKALVTENVVAIGNETKKEGQEHMFDPLLQSFVRGAGGRISYWEKEKDNQTPVVLRGITKRKEMAACRAAGRDFYYMDTGYFGNGKKKLYHRITRNDVQNFGPIIDRPGDRLEITGVKPRKLRLDGSRILLAPPSQKLLNLYDINLEEWMEKTIAQIKTYTDREIVVRYKQGRSTRVNDDPIEMALDNDIYCLVTYSSIAAGEALLHGKPAVTLGPNAAAHLCTQDLSEIENLKLPSLDEVEAWARHLAYCQFTEAEMRNGTAWRILND